METVNKFAATHNVGYNNHHGNRLQKESIDMATQILEQPSLTYLLTAMKNFIKLPTKRMWLDYDSDADVLYVHFEEQPTSTHSEMTDEGFILDYRDDQLVGVTILDAAAREPVSAN
jgi:uncharacterized protein YuzE